MAKEIVSGVGARYAVVFALDSSTGFPAASQSATPNQGTLVTGIKAASFNDPEPQRFTHYGNDKPFAQDQLPPAEAGNFTITTAKSNMSLDAALEGNKVVTTSVAGAKMRAVNTNKRGSEQQVMFFTYRQALDTDPTSATFGSLRQWQGKLYPSVRISPSSQPFEQGPTDKTYNATPTPVTSTPWADSFDETEWGATEAEAIDIVTTYQPRLNFYTGNGSRTGFALSHPPVSSSYLTVFVQGTGEVTPSSVNVSSTNPAFTLSSAAGSGSLVVALIETNAPGVA